MPYNRTSALDLEIRAINIISGNGKKIDIKRQVEKFKLSETLLLPITYGECWVLDGINLIDKMTLGGFDYITFAFGNPEQQKMVTKSFRIYNIADRKKVSNSSQTYRILFVSEELYLASQYSVSKSFKGKLVSDIVKDICTNTLKIPQDKLKIEATVGNYDIRIPYMRPFEAINYVSRFALTGTDHPSFVFYETLLEGFKYSSIETLFKNPSVAQYVYRQMRVDSLTIDPFGIIDYRVKKNFDTLSDTQSGKYASNLMTFDLVRQVSALTKFDLQEFFDKTQHLETSGSKSKMQLVENRKGDTPNKAFESHSRFMPTTLDQPKSEYVKSHQPDIKPFNVEKTNLQRNSFFQNFNDHRITIVVPGNSTIQSGQVIDLDIIAPQTQQGPAVNEQISGRYIITTISHNMTDKHKYYCELSLVKDDMKGSGGTPASGLGSFSFGDLF